MMLSSRLGSVRRQFGVGPVVAEKCPEHVDAAPCQRNDGLGVGASVFPLFSGSSRG